MNLESRSQRFFQPVREPSARSGMADACTIYRDYVLRCLPQRLEDGRYEARVVIIAGPHKLPSQRFLDLEPYASKEAAIERARDAGMDWIDNNVAPAWLETNL